MIQLLYTYFVFTLDVLEPILSLTHTHIHCTSGEYFPVELAKSSQFESHIMEDSFFHFENEGIKLCVRKLIFLVIHVNFNAVCNRACCWEFIRECTAIVSSGLVFIRRNYEFFSSFINVCEFLISLLKLVLITFLVMLELFLFLLSPPHKCRKKFLEVEYPFLRIRSLGYSKVDS